MIYNFPNDQNFGGYHHFELPPVFQAILTMVEEQLSDSSDIMVSCHSYDDNPLNRWLPADVLHFTDVKDPRNRSVWVRDTKAGLIVSQTNLVFDIRESESLQQIVSRILKVLFPG